MSMFDLCVVNVNYSELSLPDRVFHDTRRLGVISGAQRTLALIRSGLTPDQIQAELDELIQRSTNEINGEAA